MAGFCHILQTFLLIKSFPFDGISLLNDLNSLGCLTVARYVKLTD